MQRARREGLEVEVGSFSIFYRFRDYVEGFTWVFSGLYGLLKGNERKEMQEELATIRGLWDESWCLADDFNVVWFLVNKSNCKQMTLAMRQLSNFIDKFELVDLPLGVVVTLRVEGRVAYSRLG